MAKYLSESVLRSIIQEEIEKLFEEKQEIDSSDVNKLFSELDKLARDLAKRNLSQVKKEVEKAEKEKKAEIAEKRLRKKLERINNIEEHLDKIDLYFRKEVDKIEEEDEKLDPKEERVLNDVLDELGDFDETLTEAIINWDKLPRRIRAFLYDKIQSIRNKYKTIRAIGGTAFIVIEGILGYLHGVANQDREVAQQIHDIVLDILGTDFDTMGGGLPMKLAVYVLVLAIGYLLSTILAQKAHEYVFIKKIKPRLDKYLKDLKDDISDDLEK